MAKQKEKKKTSIQLYKEKIALMNELGLPEVSPYDFYRELFPAGSFERSDHPEDKKGNGMLVQLRENEHPINRIIFDDLSVIGDFLGESNVLISTCSYAGRRRNASKARFCYGFAIDIDEVGADQLRDLLFQAGNGIILTPTFVAISGAGVHAYVLFNDPIPMYPQYQKFLKELKHALTERLWNDFTSLIPAEQRQYQGIVQGFRAVGSASKCGKKYIIKAYKTGKRVDVDEIMATLPEGDVWETRKKVDAAAKSALPLFSDPIYRAKVSKALVRDNKLSLEEAKELYPEWYQHTVIEKKPPRSWTNNRALYDWWFRRIQKEIKAGHRYNAILILAIYANKCGVTEEELRRDAFSLFERYEALTEKEDNHFSMQDIETALTVVRNDMPRFPISEIARLSGLDVKKNKRNGRKQQHHIKFMNLNREFKVQQGECTNGGRPSAEHIVADWQRKNPAGRKADCIRATGLDKKTVYKWWKNDPKND